MPMIHSNLKNKIRSCIITSLFLVVASFIGYVFKQLNFAETNIVIIYILFVLLTARLTTGYFFGIMASIASTFIYNYLFTQPYFTFRVDDPSYIITFIIMTLTAVITSALTCTVKQNAVESIEKEMHTRALYELTSYLIDATDIHDIARLSSEKISQMILGRVGCLCFNEGGIPERSFIQRMPDGTQMYRHVKDVEQIKVQMERLQGSYYKGEEFYDWPIYGRERILGIVRIPKEIAVNLTDSQKRLLQAMIESTALAMDRLRESQQRLKVKEEMTQERYRGNLLRAISHDLRTPLTGIMGAAEILMDLSDSDKQEYELISGIYKDANWLRSLVENILQLTKFQEGNLVLNKRYEALEEIISGAISHCSRWSFKFDITIDMPEKVILIPIDGKLIMQVLINLLDNAMKYSKDSNKITIEVKEIEGDKNVKISVIDNGEGINPSDLPNIFKSFYTSNNEGSDMTKGVGLGLSICEAIIVAHGGVIKAQNREGVNGAIFSFTLPLEESSNE